MNFTLDNIILGFSIPVFILLIVIEVIIDYKEKKNLYIAKDTIASIAMGVGSVFVGAGMKFVALLWYSFLFQFRLFDFGQVWWAWIILFFADDFTFYWHHRLSHEIRILWAAHVNHHSSIKLNLGTALRQSWTEQLYKYFWWSWLPLIGFTPIMIFIMQTISLVYQFFQHTELVKKFPRIVELIFNTPSHHRVHHGSNIKYLDQNHAGILIIWDRIFHTFREEDESEKIIYGITSNINTYNPLKIATHEFKALINDVKTAPGLKNKLKYIFLAPGWSHDGEDLRAKTLRKKLQHGNYFRFLIFSLITLSACAYSDKFNEVNHNNEFLVTFPDYMEETDNLLNSASLQYKNAYRNTYCIITESNKNGKNLEEFQREAISILKNDVLLTKPLVTDSIYRTSENFNAIDIQLYGIMDKENIYYWHSVFESKNKFYVVACWTRSMDRQQRYGPDFIKVIKSFKPIL